MFAELFFKVLRNTLQYVLKRGCFVLFDAQRYDFLLTYASFLG